MPAKTSQIPLCRPLELGEMAQKVLQQVKKAATPAFASRPSPLLVSQRFIHEVLAFLLSKILPLPTAASTSSDTEDLCTEFDFVHMKLLSKVMAEISKDPNAEVQYLDRVQPNRVVSQTVANSVYNHLLPEFGSPSAVEKCIKAGCTILLERIVEFVLREVSGSKMQAYFLEERQRQQEAVEAERELEERYREEPKLLEGETPLRSHLKGLSLIILEEVAARLLSKIFHSFPMDDVDERDLDSVREVARKIINSLQGLISKNKLKVRQPEHLDDLGSEDSQTVGEVVDSVYTDLLQHSSSETSLYEDLTSENKDLANRVACFMVSEISRRDFQSGSESEAESPRSSSALRLESDKIIQKFLGDMEAEKAKKDSLGAQVPMVPVAFLEEILTRFLTNIFLAQCDLGFHERKNLSKTDVNVIVGLLKTSVEKQISKNKIGLVASPDNQPMLDPEYEELVNQVVHSVIRNVMEKSGSQLELYNDMTTNQVIFPEQVASIIINEVSSCNIANGRPIQETGENATRSALELDRIVSKVIARVSCHTEPDEDASLLELMDLPAAQAESIPEPEDLLESEELPVNIVPHLGGKPLKIDPNFVSDHLAVLSIKTEPLNKLEKMCLSKTGMSLMELRRVSASGKSVCNNMTATDVNKRKDRRPSLDMAGRLGVRPREAVCRNSFQSLMKPDIRKVELLKDVESKQDLMLRLVVHDISEDQHRWNPDVEGSDTDEEEQVLTEHRSFYFPPTAPQTDSTASVYTPREFSRGSSLNQKKSMVMGRGYPSITVSGASSERKEGSTSSTLPHISITTQSFVSQIPELDEEVSMSSTPHQEMSKSPSAMASDPSVHPVASDDKSQMKETSMEKVVGMHLSRDTEETSGHFEITSVYQDKKIQDSVSEQPSEVEDGKVINVTSSDQAMPERRRSSVLRRVSNTLSKVFSRTSSLGEDKSAPGDRP
ncbi:hypothetical protein JRQ81_012228 [Phrynocephalus forsythii]|uniref:Fibrous sheath-interacting protein 2 C-terminal domain-containing protein n=1 Tax=Phrynocephalus forsythii TaxID=171643 RepID=A0A9Q0X5K2_9SAUR|nr:hypothetical protein JRQ81_012228 [Phrynocephalus forsythii]